MIRQSPGQQRRAIGLFVLGLVVGALLLPLMMYLYVASGRAPVAVLDPELPFENILTTRAVRARLARGPCPSPPIPADETNLRAGAHLYGQHCAVCHGLPGGRVSKVASGMFPPPPQLFHDPGGANDAVAETYWKIAYGIRLTGMPAFRNALSDTEMWQISLLLANAAKLPASVTAQLDRATGFGEQAVEPTRRDGAK